MALRNRLLRDIAELQEKPYPNIKFVSHESNITTACLILTTVQQRLHLTINFPDQYPLKPPQITIQTYVEHPNVFGDYICASILNTEEGYTPAYDLKGICIQILSFFSSDSIEQQYGGRPVSLPGYSGSSTGRLLGSLQQSYNCSHCDFHVIQPQNPRPSPPGYDVPLANESKKTRGKKSTSKSTAEASTEGSNRAAVKGQKILLSDMPDEILAVICEKLEIEELAPFAQAWDHIGGEQGIVNRFNIIRNRELMCFCLKKSVESAQLGIGIHAHWQGRTGSFESEFDLLSLQAYDEFNIRKSVQGLPFSHWLPLPITRRHYNSVQDQILSRLQLMAQFAGLPQTEPAAVLYAFMNDIVVRLCKQAESGYSRSSLVHASEKAIESYYHLFHLLLCLATEDDGLRRSANQTIKSFLIEGKSGKKDVPNLGYLLVAVLISDADMTNDLLLAIIRETVTRNVVWMLDKKGANMPELAYMEANSISRYRLEKTFEASKTSYRLLMFLNLFRKTISRGTGTEKKTLTQVREELFDAHGAPPRGTAARLASDVKALQKVKSFPEFITIMGLQPPPASQFTIFLRDCVEDSVRKGYSVWGITQARALTLRQMKDTDVQIREEQKPEWSSRGGFDVSFFPNPPKKIKGGPGRNNRR